MTNAQNVEQIEVTIEETKAQIAKGEALERLYNNRDFQKIIGEGYFNEQAVRLVHLKADPAMASEASQASIVKEMDAIGALSVYLRQVEQGAAMAAKALADYESERELMVAEGDE